MSRRKQQHPKALKDDETGNVAIPKLRIKDQVNCDIEKHAANQIINLAKRRKILDAINKGGVAGGGAANRNAPSATPILTKMKLETAPVEAMAPQEERDNASSKGKSSSNSLTLSLVNKVNELSNNNQQPSKKKGAHIRNDHHNNNKSEEERSPSEGKNFQNSNEIKPDKTNGESYKSHFENGTYICPLCDEVMTTSHEFTVHIRQHNPNDHSHTCRLCGKTLSSASSLDRHMLVHSGERPFKCKLCTMAFTTNGNMHRHMRTHGEDAEQFKRDAAAAAAANAATNGRTKHSHKRKAETPASASNNQNSKRVELESNGVAAASETDAETREQRCPICDKSFANRLVLEEHMKLHANDPIYCKECNGTFSIYSAYRDHNCKGGLVNGTGNRFAGVGFQDLSFIDFSSNKFSLIAKSVCESNSRRPSSAFHAFECEKCDKSFPCASALRLHAVTHSDPRGTYCATCECDFLTPRGLQTHQLKHRMTEQCGEINLIMKEGERDFADDKTGSSLMAQPPEARKEDFLAVLQLKNNDSRKIPKIKIKKDRTKENNFENVSYFVHGKPEPPKYVGGGKEGIPEPSDFADIQSIISVTSKSPFAGGIRSSPVVATPASPLQANSSTCVSPESPIAADSANASPETPSKEDSEHSSIKGSEDADTDGAIVEGIYSCKLCNLHYNKVSQLKRHNREHPQSCSSYSCSLCPYNSTDKSTLVRHLRTHNGERPFQCIICKFAFTTKANCERHVRKRHKKQTKHEIRSSMQYNPNMGDTVSEALPPEISGSETVCKYCTVDFKSNRVLRHHLRSLHNSCRRKPFFCTLCKLGFSTKNNCIRHVAKQHPGMKEKLRDIVISNNSQSDCSDQEESGVMSEDGGSPSKWDSSQTADSNHNWEFGSLNETQSPQQRSFDLSSKATPTDLSQSGSAPNKEPVEESVPVPPPLPLPLPQPLSLTRSRPTANEDQPLNLTVTALCLSSKLGGNENESSVTDDVVSAANGLVSLSEVAPPQDEPLDLAVHALDLTVKTPQTKAIALTVDKDPKQANFFNMRRIPAMQYYPRPPTSRALRMPFPPMPSLTAQAPLSLLVRNRSSIVVPTVPPPLPPPPPPPPSNRDMIPVPVNHVTTNESSYRAFKIVNDRLSPRNQRSFSCVYCSAGFTLKSNMERHIKRKHPQFARPTRSRNFIPTLSPTISKNTVQTLSNKTRDALRVVLTSKAGSASSGGTIISSKDEDKIVSSASREDVEDPRKARDESFHSELSNAELSLMSVSSAGRGGESTAEERETEDGELVIECPEPDTASKTDPDQKETTRDLPTDLASVSSVIDTANSQQFPQFLTTGEGEAGKNEEMDEGDDEEDEEDAEDEEDEDGEMKDNKESVENMPLESSDNQSSPSNSSAKKRSSYMDSPNSVACPFCSRKFPWTSSLRRHILTHTGQKPFKCPRCPIWFTTKSNCERHLMRKHGQNSDILTRTVPDRPYKCNVCPSSTFSTSGNLRKHYYLKHFHKTGSASRGTVIGAKNKSKPSEPEQYEDVVEGDHLSDSLEEGALPGSPEKSSDHSDSPYKCHLCEVSFDVRKDCLSHLESAHAEEYKRLVENSPPDSAGGMEESEGAEKNNNEEKLDDIAENGHLDEDGRKLRCAFCTRRFWSGEDLRRHVKTHSGARPFACDICNRTFSLKHIMIRHRRKHSGKSSSAMAQDSSDDDCSAPPKVDLNVPSTRPKKQKRKPKSQNSLLYLMPRDENDPKSNSPSGGVKNETGAIKKEEDTDLIQNLLGIRDSKMIDQMLDSADSAARLLGVKEV